MPSAIVEQVLKPTMDEAELIERLKARGIIEAVWIPREKSFYLARFNVNKQTIEKVSKQ